MARFYFDFHDACGILRDDVGEEFPALPSRERKR